VTGSLLQIFLYFAKAGMFVFGSGLAVVPFLYGGVVQGHHWLTDHQFVDAVAIAMITPGPVVITVAFIGYLVAGVAGATAAALGIFLPVYLVVLVLAPSYKKWAKNPQLNAFVRGVTAAATGAIAGAVIVLARRSVYDLPTIMICAISLAVPIPLESSRASPDRMCRRRGVSAAPGINQLAPETRETQPNRPQNPFCYNAYDAFATVCSSRGGHAFQTRFISAFPARRLVKAKSKTK
jgi:chromate transport protein ChrA